MIRGMCLASLGMQRWAIVLMLAAPIDAQRVSSFHQWLGWSVLVLALLQLLSALARGTKGGPTDARADGSLFGDHYNMTARRKRFELLHKAMGYALMLLALVTTISGLSAA